MEVQILKGVSPKRSRWVPSPFPARTPVRESHDVIDAPRSGRDQIGGRERGPVSLTSTGCKEVILYPAKLCKITMKLATSDTTRIDRMDISLSLSAMRGARRSMIDFVGRSRSLSLAVEGGRMHL